MSTTETRITADRTVNEVIKQYPATIPVFNEFGIDSCCGGAVSLRVAAERDGADLRLLLDRLSVAIGE